MNLKAITPEVLVNLKDSVHSIDVKNFKVELWCNWCVQFGPEVVVIGDEWHDSDTD